MPWFIAVSPKAQTSLVAVGELRVEHLGAPIELRRDHIELGGVPEGAAIRVNAHCAVVAPTIRSANLRAGAVQHHDFRFKRAQRIGVFTAGDCDRGIDGAAGNAVAEQYVLYLVARNRTKPAVVRAVRRPRSRLEQ